jgi:hypothetical protein
VPLFPRCMRRDRAGKFRGPHGLIEDGVHGDFPAALEGITNPVDTPLARTADLDDLRYRPAVPGCLRGDPLTPAAVVAGDLLPGRAPRLKQEQ